MKFSIFVVLSMILGAVLGFAMAGMWLDHHFRIHGGGNSHDDLVGVAVTCQFGIVLGAIIASSFVSGALKCLSQDLTKRRAGEWLIAMSLGLLLLILILLAFA